MLSAQPRNGHPREEMQLSLPHPGSPSPMRDPRPINYPSHGCGTSEAPSLHPEVGTNFEQSEVPVLGEFAV